MDHGDHGGPKKVIHAFFYKNTLYKNIEPENDSKIKNILRICSGSTLLSRSENLWNPIYNLRTDIPVYLHYVKGLQKWSNVTSPITINSDKLINKNIEGHIVCWSFSHTKNILRIYEADICQKVKNTEAQTKKHYSYKKKSV